MVTEKKEVAPARNRELWFSFAANITIVILLFFLGIFIGLFLSNKKLIEKELLTRAKSHFQSIVHTREWNARYGGVYVKKNRGMVSNPYLENPDITAADGSVYTKKNPALMTREISELASKSDLYYFHITSLKPLNPENKADDFEKKALEDFANGQTEIYGKYEKNGHSYYRYMAPLYTEKSCLSCHEKQGYREGDIRGGISVAFNIDEIERSLVYNRYIIILLYILTTIALLSIIYFFIIKFNNKLASTINRMKILAITDPLTHIYNRRYFSDQIDEELQRSKRYNHALSCLLLDLDFFKKVNDTYGHHAGDTVLHTTAQLLREHTRTHDIIARYGGEEFIVLLPETGADQATQLAEHLRMIIENHKFALDDFITIKITTSIGVAGFDAGKIHLVTNADMLVNLADKALYQAKENGRNRTEKIVFDLK